MIYSPKSLEKLEIDVTSADTKIRDITVSDFEDIYNELERIAETHEIRDNYRYIGLRE